MRAGKIRYIGCSNFSGWHLMKSLAVSEKYGLARYVAHQAYYSLIGRDYEWELMPLALDQKVGASSGARSAGAGSPARSAAASRCPRPAASRARSRPTSARRSPTSTCYRVVDALDEVAAETGKTVPQIALNWLLQRPSVANVIIGARNEEQLRQNLGAVGWNLTPEQVARLDAASADDARLSLLAPAALRRAEPAAGVMAAVGVRAEKHMPDRVRRPQPALCEPRLWDRLAEVRFALVRSPSTTGLGKAWVSYVESQSIQGIGGA